MKVAALTPGYNIASSRFRVRQYIPLLKANGIEVTEYPSIIRYSSKLPGLLGKVKQRYIFPISAFWLALKGATRSLDIVRSNSSDFVWVNRIIVNPVYAEGFIKKPLIYDIDDAIWINREKLIGKIAGKAEIILAGNKFIADNLERYNRNIRIVPTAIDTDRFKPGSKEDDGLFRILW